MDCKSSSFNESTINSVWEKGQIVPGYDSDILRKDIAGAWMERDKYGDRSRELGFGWEIDHRKPISEGGSDNLDNLQPLQWSNNCSKGDSYPNWESAISSEGDHNVHKKAKLEN